MKLCKKDVLSVAKTLKIKLTDKEVKKVLTLYPTEQLQDPTGTWNVVVEKIIDDLGRSK